MYKKINIDRIITEQINKMVFEAEEHMTSREDFEERTAKARKRDGSVVNKADGGEVRDFLRSPYIVAGAVVQDATGVSPEGAASMATKIANGERPVTQNLAKTVGKIKNELK